jgi:hypothetical protein
MNEKEYKNRQSITIEIYDNTNKRLYFENHAIFKHDDIPKILTYTIAAFLRSDIYKQLIKDGYKEVFQYKIIGTFKND